MQTNEHLTEHTLTHNSTLEQRQHRGPVDFDSPRRVLIQEEQSCENIEKAIWEDATDCSNKLLLLCISQQASESLRRANSNVGLRIVAAIAYHAACETLSSIGERIGKRRAVVGRYKDRFIGWSSENCAHLLERITPELLIDFCSKQTSAPLTDTLDELRIALTELLHSLLSAAEDPDNHKTEVFLDEERFNKSPYIMELLETI